MPCAAQLVHVAGAGARRVEDNWWQGQGREERGLPGIGRSHRENATLVTTMAAISRAGRPRRDGHTQPSFAGLGKGPDVATAPWKSLTLRAGDVAGDWRVRVFEVQKGYRM